MITLNIHTEPVNGKFLLEYHCISLTVIGIVDVGGGASGRSFFIYFHG